PLIAKPDLICWLEEEEEGLFLLGSDEEEGLAVSISSDFLGSVSLLVDDGTNE
ncbi:UNVERIFIED_CONTAM: hypothetical protein K2H54_065376, partial [Gekko kuhli]